MTLHQELAYLQASGLVQPSSGAGSEPLLAFRHALVQDAAYQSLLKRQRRNLHQLAGEVLESFYQDQREPGDLAALLGHHFALAGDGARAVRYLSRAGQAAAQRYANAEAIEYYQRALDLAAQGANGNLGELFVRLGRLQELSGHYLEALETYGRMAQAASDRADREMELESLLRRATIHSTPNPAFNPPLAHEFGQQALGLAQALGMRAAEAKAHWCLSLLFLYTGQAALSADSGETALGLAREAGDRELLGYVLNDLAMAYVSSDRISSLGEILGEAREIWQALGNLPMLSENYTRSAVGHAVMGWLELAQAEFSEALRLSRLSHNREGEIVSQAFAGLPQLESGQTAEAIATMRQAIALGEQVNDWVALAGTRSELADTLAQFGQVDEAFAAVQQALATARQNFPLLAAWPLSVLAQLHMTRGELDQAEAALADVEHFRVLKQQLNFIPMMWVCRAHAAAELALQRRDYAQAHASAGELIQSLRVSGMRTYLPRALRYKARALLGGDQPDRAEAWRVLSEARALAEGMGTRRSLWPVLADLAALERQRGHHAQASVLLQQARQVAGYLVDNAGSAELREGFLGRPEVRRLMANA